MVLYLDEYEVKNKVYGDHLHYYNNLPDKYLHKMQPQEILNHINRNGVISSVYQKIAVVNYIRWLADNHGSELDIDLANFNYELDKLLKEDGGCYIGFYNLKELKQTIEEKLQELNDRNIDFNGLKSIFFLEWYGVPITSAIKIKLSDVSDDGKQVCVSNEDRTVFIDDIGVANFLAEYKQQIGFKKFKNERMVLYSQDTFYRTTSNARVTPKTIYNARLHFQSITHDPRFDKKRVYNAGRYFQLLQEEQNSGNIFVCSDQWTQSVINKVFNFKKSVDIQIYVRILRDYKLYKMGCLNLE